MFCRNITSCDYFIKIKGYLDTARRKSGKKIQQDKRNSSIFPSMELQEVKNLQMHCFNSEEG